MLLLLYKIFLISLKVTFDHELILSSKDQRFKLVRWMDCIESVAETLSHVNGALMDVVNYTKLSQEGKLNILDYLITDQQLFCLHGVDLLLLGTCTLA